MCRRLFWGYGEDQRKMIFVRWSSICKPYEEGGLNIKEVLSWNKASPLKHIWEICENKGGNWCQWVNTYYLKGGSFWNVEYTQNCSWIWKCILKLRDELLIKFGCIASAESFLRKWGSSGKFNLCAAYDDIRPRENIIPWKRTIWESMSVPKHKVILWFAMKNGLTTINDMGIRGYIIHNICVLCCCAIESKDHLFF